MTDPQTFNKGDLVERLSSPGVVYSVVTGPDYRGAYVLALNGNFILILNIFLRPVPKFKNGDTVRVRGAGSGYLYTVWDDRPDASNAIVVRTAAGNYATFRIDRLERT